MRIEKAFTLIEIVVVIFLLGIIFSLVISSFDFSKKDVKSLSIKDIPSYIKEHSSQKDVTFYAYGIKCDKFIFFSKGGQQTKAPSFGITKDVELLKRDNNGDYKKVDFSNERLEKRSEHICFKLEFSGGKFVDKLIVKVHSKFYLFGPFFQDVKLYNSFEDIQNALHIKLNSTDEFYRE